MMKIHTTQDLSVLARQQQLSTTNSVSLSNIRFAQGNSETDDQGGKSAVAKRKPNYKLINMAILLSGLAVIGSLYTALSRSRAAAAPKFLPEDLKKTIKEIKGVKVENIKEEAVLEKTRNDKMVDSKFFNWLLERAENEPVMQAAMAALICLILRPVTIMTLPSKDGKENNMYASAHSMSSGVMGLISTTFIAQPFKTSAKYTLDVYLKDFKEDALKRLHPKLDIKSIYKNGVSGERKPVSEWLFKDGNKFLSSFKDVEKIPKLKPLNEISAKAFKAFNADVDWAAQKGKSFNEVMTKDGKRLYDVIDWNNLGIVVEQQYTGPAKVSEKFLKESTKDAKVLLKDLDREFLEKIIKDAEKDSHWKQLDLNTVYKDNKVVDFRQWKDLSGKQWELDLGNTYLSSPYDTVMYMPRISVKHRIESTGEVKYAAYLKNGKDGALGSIFDEEIAETQRVNEVLDKLLTWAPDILTRPLVATATIALIPIALKKVFHLEKAKKPEASTKQEEVKPQKEEDTTKVSNTEQAKQETPSFKGRNSNNDNDISFKGAKPDGEEVKGLKKLFQNLIVKPLAKLYGKTMYESKGVYNAASRLSRVPGGFTNHMSSLGALLTSSVYIYRTLNKKDLDDDRRRTLAINQALCFVVPTICAYTVDKLLRNWAKEKIEYIYAGRRESEIANAKLAHKSEAEIKAMQEGLGKKLAGIRTLVSLAIFAMIYRYVAPVIITPFANWIGDRVMEKKHAKAEAEANANKQAAAVK